MLRRGGAGPSAAAPPPPRGGGAQQQLPSPRGVLGFSTPGMQSRPRSIVSSLARIQQLAKARSSSPATPMSRQTSSLPYTVSELNRNLRAEEVQAML
eukprot:gene8803-2414_t